ncbi:MAG: DUF211 domain-containing protein [Pseudomonadota bacterium]
MTYVKHIVLDVLKPHQPNALEFARGLAERGGDFLVTISVQAVDEKTESVLIEIRGGDIDFDAVQEAIGELGGSVHSIDAVEVQGGAE